MGEQTGVIRLKGKIGELTFRQADGKTIVGVNSSLRKDRIKTDPAFQRTRENNREFAGSVQSAAAMKLAFASVYKRFADNSAFNRMVVITRSIISKDVGIRGARPVDLVAHKLLLNNFEFHQTDKLRDAFSAPFSATNNADRNQIDYTIPDFNTLDYLTIPEGATHIRFIAAISSVSNYEFSNQGNGYEPTNLEQDSLGSFVSSTEIPIGGMVGADTTLQAILPGSPVLAPEVVMLGALGIEFLLDLGGTFYTLASGNALKITHTA